MKTEENCKIKSEISFFVYTPKIAQLIRQKVDLILQSALLLENTNQLLINKFFTNISGISQHEIEINCRLAAHSTQKYVGQQHEFSSFFPGC